jgi:hypothetical protein
LNEEENRRAHPEAKWPTYKINQRVWNYIDAKRETNYKFRPSWEKATIVGILGTAAYKIRREIRNKKVKTVNMQKLKPRQCGDGDRPPDQDKPGRNTKGRRIPEENKMEDENVTKEVRDNNATPEVPQQEETQVQDETEEQGQQEQEQNSESDHAEQEDEKGKEELSEDKEDNKKTKRYNLRKRKVRTVYVSASKVFRLDNLRDTDDVIEAMKRGYK